MKRTVCLSSAALALTLLVGCAAPTPTPEPSASSGSVCYVPLDDRPDNAERVEYLANSLGYNLLMPEQDWYATKLDGQGQNQNGAQSGDRGALYEWVLAQEADGCDRYILSLDQLLSGGLVNSRHMAESEPVTCRDGSVLTETRLAQELVETLAADGNNQVWLLDTVMRLAPTAGYDGCGLNEYNVLRTYGMEARPALSGRDLTLERVIADYALAPDGTPLTARSDEPLAEGAVENYLAARARKLRLSDEMQRLLAQPGRENFHLLVGIDDSSAEDSIQKNEIALLRAGLRTDSTGAAADWILSGVDDLAFKAVTKLFLGECDDWRSPAVTARVTYFGGTEALPACDYDYQPLTEIVAEHLDFFAVDAPEKEPESSWAAIQVLVLTQPADGEQGDACCQSLIDQLLENQRQAWPTILIDASNGAYGAAFHDKLVRQCQLGFLLSYAGFLDMAIVTGTALSHGFARYAMLRDSRYAGADDLCNLAFQKTLTESLVLDIAYKNAVRPQLLTYVRSTLGGDPNNFCVPPVDLGLVQAQLASGMEKQAKAVLKNLSRSSLLVSLDQSVQESGEDLARWGSVTLSNWSFPWNRAFEVRMDIAPSAVTAIHKKLFGLF